MNILIVSATEFEVKPLLDYLKISHPILGLNSSNNSALQHSVDVLITGVGMVNTALMMGKYLNTSYDLAINAGVCGAFNKNLELGQLVHITQDTLSELGAEDGDVFLTYDKLNLPGDFQFMDSLIHNLELIHQLKRTTSITVNTVHGNDASIKKAEQLFNPDVESMEGAAFYAACKSQYKNYTQIRAVSNYVEKRDKSKWQMPLAIKNLNDFLINFIETRI